MISALMLLSLTACQKESNQTQIVPSSKMATGLMTPAVNQPPAVVIMNLVGTNTYQGYFHGSGIQITGPVAYDDVKYPTVVDGIPAFVESMSTYDGASVLTSENSGTEGNVFSVSVPILGGLPSTGFQTDFDSYSAAWNTWADGDMSNSTMPLLQSYLKTSYSQVGHSITYTGKVIRVTSGSGVALTEITYPLPTAATATSAPNLGGFCITDPNNATIQYLLSGTDDIINNAAEGINNNYSANIYATVTGSYKHTNGTGIFHCWGTIIRPDGTSFKFDSTQDLS
jgi:hypothetical protein